MSISATILLGALRDPHSIAALTPADWSKLVFLGRATALLGRIAADSRKTGLFDRLPEAVQGHLMAAERGAALSQTLITWEVDRIKRAFWGQKQRIILLKGAAYIQAKLPCAAGRPSSDIDILVGRAELSLVEATLLQNGWEAAKTTTYDDHYYREWMHELPPLRHPSRQTMIDLHHTILPLTSRLKPDAAKLLSAAQPIDDHMAVLSDTDLILHSAVHLFQDGDIRNALRDLVDQRDLMRHFAGQNPEFWQRLLTRGGELGLGRPLYYSMRYAHRLLALEIPHAVLAASNRFAPPAPVRLMMDHLVEAAILPTFLFETRRFADFAGLMLYVRSHWLRMPPLLLARHLTTKMMRRFGFGEARARP